MHPIDHLFQILTERGAERYGEGTVNQLEHALQSAALAEQEGADAALITAALFHDIGHMINPKEDELRLAGRDARHEQTGAAYLAKWFGPDVTGPVRRHVEAKRYLVAAEPAYAASLSPASQHSLEMQGGAFTPAEAEAFLAEPHAEDGLRLRRWDEAAKAHGLATPGLEHFRPYVERAYAEALV
jgi:[1-hydroxy-2-(trimethylamino)ethyl]phosphonate dioxygenase